jgi:hypothetical protein
MPSRDSESPTDHRRPLGDTAELAGVAVRDADIEPAKGLRSIAILFRGMAVLLLILMVLQVIFAATSTVPLSLGVVVGDAVRLIIFAGLLWGAGDLAVLAIKSHYDLRATRILTARVSYILHEMAESGGKLTGNAGGLRPDREP